MKMYTANPKGRIAAVVAAATVIVLSARGETAAGRVSLNRSSFNPSLGESVSITVRTPPASRVSIVVLDRDGYATRWLAKAQETSDTYTATWNGRDGEGAVVADEAYSFKVDVVSASGTWTYFPAASTPKTYPVQAKHYSRRNASLMYDLPAPARIHAQAGSAAIDANTKTYNGPVLKTLVNREPRPAGAIVESWNGLDESGAIYVPDLAQFVAAILATELPENAVIAFGNRSRSFLDMAAARRGASLLPAAKAHSHQHHHGLNALEDVSPSLTITPLGGVWNEQAKAWIVEGDTVRLRVALSGQTAPYVRRHPAKIVTFVDYVQQSEQAVHDPAQTISVRLGDRQGRAQVVSINWQSEYGPLAPNSIRVMRAAGQAAHGSRRNASGVAPERPEEESQ